MQNQSPAPSLAALARISPRSDSDLLRLATGADTSISPAAANLACALFHERIGSHKPGQPCAECDMPAALRYAASLTIMGEPQIVVIVD